MTNSRIESLPEPDFDDLAIAAVSAWTFQPATQGGPGRRRSRRDRALRARTLTVGSEIIEIKARCPRTCAVTRARPAWVPPREVASRGQGASPNPADARRDQPARLAPGILLTNEGGEGHAEQVFLRGFDAREGQDIELASTAASSTRSATCTATATPTCTSSSRSWSSRCAWSRAPSIRGRATTPSPAAPTTSSASAARGLTASYGAGSFGTSRALLLWGPPDEDSHTFGGVETVPDRRLRPEPRRPPRDRAGPVRGQGRRHRHLASHRGRLPHQLPHRRRHPRGRLRRRTQGLLRHLRLRPGRRRLALLRPGRRRDPARRRHLPPPALADRQTCACARTSPASCSTCRSRSSSPTPSAATSSTSSPTRRPRRCRLGARRAHRRRASAGVELGYFAPRRSHRRARRPHRAANGHPYHTDTDLDATLGDIGLYAAGDLELQSWLTLRGGVRTDLFTYDVIDNCAVQEVAHPSPDNPPGDAELPVAAGLRQLPRAGPARQRRRARSSCRARRCWSARSRTSPPRSSYGEGVRSIDPGYITQDVATPFASIKSLRGRRRLRRQAGPHAWPPTLG